jgi:methionine-gamma-lyase
MKDKSHKLQDSTRIIHGGGEPDPAWGGVCTPIYQSSTFSFATAAEGAARFAGQEEGYIYTRMGNPTNAALESSLTELEEGYGCMATASGMAAITTTFLALLNSGDHMISTGAVYGPSRNVLEQDFIRFGVESSFVNTARLDEIEQALRPETRLIYVETPANPTLEVTDIEAVAALARKHSLLLVVDNTFATPYLQKPLQMGADIVVHSLTKFINGHSDVVGGAIVTKSEELFKRIRRVLNFFGGTMDPHQAWLVLRGLKTLALRLDRSVANAITLAGFLEQHPAVTKVTFPGLSSHPQYELAKRIMRQPGSMISFEVKGGLEAGRKVMDNVQICTLAVSLGGFETLIQHPASMTHAGISAENRLQAHITDGLVRLSVGCEDAGDLQHDLEQALNLSQQ